MRAACLSCRAARRKCVVEEGEASCSRCQNKGQVCEFPEEQAGQKRKGSRGRSCTHCHRLKRLCSSCKSGRYPCELCVKEERVCVVRETQRKLSQNKANVQALSPAEVRFSLALNAPRNVIAAIDEAILPAAFGLTFKPDSNWALFWFPQENDPVTIGFLLNAILIKFQLKDPRFSAGLGESSVGKRLQEIMTKSVSEAQQILSSLTSKPGRPRIKRMLELNEIVDGKICSVVVNSLHDVEGVCRLQFVQIEIVMDQKEQQKVEGEAEAFGMGDMDCHISMFKDEDWFHEIDLNVLQEGCDKFELSDLDSWLV